MQFLKLGITAIATGVLATLTMAPAAMAQQPQVQLTKQMVQPMNEARNAIIAKDWATAKTKLNAAAAQAKTPQDKLALERMRVVVASETKDGLEQVRSAEAMLASGLLTPDEVKQFKGVLVKGYADAGDLPKSSAAMRAYIDAYGGTHDQYAGLGGEMLKANDTAGAVAYGNKALEAAKTAGVKAPESYYILLMRAHKAANEMDKYYAVEEQIVGAYPKEIYWKELIAARTQGAAKYGGPIRLDMFRALQAANVKLTPQEKRTAANEALKRGLPNEAVAILEAGVAAGELTTPDDQASLKDAKDMLAGDKPGLAKEAADALAKGNGTALANIGEAMLSHGDNAKAIELIQAGLAKGISDPGEADIAKLHLGIAQFRAGQKDAARATWTEIKSDNGAAAVARNWIVLSNVQS